MLKRRSFWIVLITMLVAAGVSANVLKKRAAPPDAPVAAPAQMALEFLPSDVTEVKPRDLRQILLLSGSLRAVNQVSVKAKLAGEVREVLVREGEAIKAGQLLVKIDPTEYQARLDQAKGSLMAARGQLDMATKARDNNQALVAKGFISQNAFDNASSQYDIARANAESAKGALDVAQKALNDAVIRAPISGLVSMRNVQPGEKVSADNRLLDVIDLSKMELEAAVPTNDITSVALGQEVQLKVEGLPTLMTGKVARINPATQAGSRSVMTYIQVDNPQGLLRAGMFAEAQLTLSKKSGVLTAPQSAIQNAGNAASLYAIENGKIVQKTVTLGIRGKDDNERGDGGAVEILSGVDNGARIVKTNLGNLKSGTAVRFAKAVQPSKE
ncbi:MAG: efflux RND transporter periplasmic adaptor subunit [Burkholderiales bacterium]|nr:efflux RND transporter periplasmic adaptor subunit [Burkholderiales bacterium]